MRGRSTSVIVAIGFCVVSLSGPGSAADEEKPEGAVVVFWRADPTLSPEDEIRHQQKEAALAAQISAASGRDVAEIQQERRDARQAYLEARIHPSEMSASSSVKSTHYSRADLVDAIEAMEPTMQAYHAETHHDVDPTQGQITHELWRMRMEALLARMPADGIEEHLPAAHIGQGSIEFGLYSSEIVEESACNSPSNPQAPAFIEAEIHCNRGPINVVFYGVGSSIDVRYDMINLGNIEWEDTTGAARSAFFYDARHAGADAWVEPHQNSLQPESDQRCFDDRHHIRTWQSVTGDTHGAFGTYSLGQAHYEDYEGFFSPCQHDVISQNQGRDKVRDTFLNAGSWVGAVWYFNHYGTGTDFDGRVLYIELLA